MGDTYLHSAGILVALLSTGIAIFQVLLTFGYPLGEATMGGKYRILPKRMRIASAFSAIILLFMGFVFLQHTKVVIIDFNTDVLVWIFTIYLGVNTLLNLISRSKKERTIMTPVSSVTFLLCLIVALS